MKKIPSQKESTNMRNIKGYIDTAVSGVKSEILTRIDLLDKRDRDQFDGARLLIIDANTLMHKRQELVEKQVEEMKTRIEDMGKNQQLVVSKIDNTMENLHNKLDKHLIDEADSFDKLNAGQATAATRFKELTATLTNLDLDGSKGLQELKKTIDNVSANGNRGLQASLKDMYEKNQEVHNDVKSLKTDIQGLKELVEPKLARDAWWKSTQHLFRTTRLFRFITSKIGFIFFTFAVIVIINLISQAFTGVPLISLEHFAMLFKWIGKLFI
jgi:iron-sulfur cluster repair protein YtfE (RIC family)